MFSLRRIGTSAVLLVALSATAWPAASGGPRIPRVFASAQGEVRRAGLIYYQENEPLPEGGCSGFIADGFGVVRNEVPVRAGRVRARLEVRTPARPDRVRVTVWRELNEDGFPQGPGRVVRSDVRRERRGWVVAIHPFVSEVTYGELSVRWRDQDGCGPEEGLGCSCWRPDDLSGRPASRTLRGPQTAGAEA